MDVEVVRRQIRYELAVLVGDNGVEPDDVDGDAKAGRVGRSRLLGGAGETRG
jgi:hypothetical protein